MSTVAVPATADVVRRRQPISTRCSPTTTPGWCGRSRWSPATRRSAADAVQEAFVKAHLKWRKISRYDDPIGWVRRVAINQIRDGHRRHERKNRALRRLAVAASDGHRTARARRVRAPAGGAAQPAAGGDRPVLRRRALDRRDRGRPRHRRGIGEITPARRPPAPQAAARGRAIMSDFEPFDDDLAVALRHRAPDIGTTALGTATPTTPCSPEPAGSVAVALRSPGARRSPPSSPVACSCSTATRRTRWHRRPHRRLRSLPRRRPRRRRPR